MTDLELRKLEELEKKMADNREDIERLRKEQVILESEFRLLKRNMRVTGNPNPAVYNPAEGNQGTVGYSPTEGNQNPAAYNPAELNQGLTGYNPIEENPGPAVYNPAGLNQGPNIYSPAAGNTNPTGSYPAYKNPIPSGTLPERGANGSGKLVRDYTNRISPRGTAVFYDNPGAGPQKKHSNPVIYDSSAVPARKNTESLFGKRIMAVVAAFLIFISLVLFGIQLSASFSDTAKLAIMFFGSAVFTVAGLVLIGKNSNSSFNIAICGVGMGGFYISLFMGNIYFNLIPELPLFACLLVWAAAALLLSWRISMVFHVIGNVGILISVFFGVLLCVDRLDDSKFLFLVVYFMVGSIAYIALSLRKKAEFIISSVFNLFSILVLSFGFMCFEVEKSSDYSRINAGLLLLCLYILAIHIALLYFINEENRRSYPIVGLFYSAGLATMLSLLFYENDYAGLVVTVFMVLIFAAVEWRIAGKVETGTGIISGKKHIPNAGCIWELALIGIVLFESINSELMAKCLALFILLIVLILLYHFVTFEPSHRFAAVIVSIVTIFFDAGYPLAELFIVIVISAMALGFMHMQKESYTTGFKIWWTIYALLSLVIRTSEVLSAADVGREPRFTLIFSIAVVLLSAAAKSPYGRDWNKGVEEKTFVRFTYLVCAIMMLVGLYGIADAGDVVCRMVIIAMTLVLFMLNSAEFLKDKEGRLPHVYVGVKFTVFVLVVLESFDSPASLVSIALFALAAICIVFGFMLEAAGIRIYGLLLSMICVFKLLVIDLSYENNMERAVSFFISGLLCLGISAVYNRIDKKRSK